MTQYKDPCPRCVGKIHPDDAPKVLFRWGRYIVAVEAPPCWVCRGRGFLIRSRGSFVNWSDLQ